MKMPRKPGIEALTPSGGPNDAAPRQSHGHCGTCLKRFSPKQPHQAFCSPRCRAMSWWAVEIASAIRRGEAEGLRRKT